MTILPRGETVFAPAMRLGTPKMAEGRREKRLKPPISSCHWMSGPAEGR